MVKGKQKISFFVGKGVLLFKELFQKSLKFKLDRSNMFFYLDFFLQFIYPLRSALVKINGKKYDSFIWKKKTSRR